MKKHTAKEFLSTDGRRRVTIFEMEDGRYGFREESLLPGATEGSWAPLWQPVSVSYVTEEAAEKAAALAIKWLGELPKHG